MKLNEPLENVAILKLQLGGASSDCVIDQINTFVIQ